MAHSFVEMDCFFIQHIDKSIMLSTYVVDDDEWCDRANVIEHMKKQYANAGLNFDELCIPKTLSDGRKQYTIEQKQHIDDAFNELHTPIYDMHNDSMYSYYMMSALICRFGKSLVKSKERWDFHISELYDIYKILNATIFDNAYANDISIMIAFKNEIKWPKNITRISKHDDHRVLMIDKQKMNDVAFMSVVRIIACEMLSYYCNEHKEEKHIMQLYATIAPCMHNIFI